MHWKHTRRGVMSLVVLAVDAYLRDPKHDSDLRAKGLEPLPGSPADAVRF
ncbi:hypothetical protein OKW42_002802 [Paraburkholderia sp. WC7.3d]